MQVSETIKEIFKRNLLSLRKRAGFTQEILAERADLAATHLSQIENGIRWPKPETITSLAEALDVSEAELFFDLAGKPETSPQDALKILSDFVEKNLPQPVKKT